MRKSTRLLAMLGCVSLSVWGIGCADTTGGNKAAAPDTAAADPTSSGSDADDIEAGSGESSGGATEGEGIDVPLPNEEAGSATESE